MEIAKILAAVDHTLLAPDATWAQIQGICDDAMTWHTATVCIPASYVARCKAYMQGRADAVGVCTVIGFPTGYATTAVKAYEAGLEMMGTLTSAKVGDKTMMDAMIPAIEAMSATVAQNASATLHDVFVAAADAALEGAEKTKEYVAKFGRARNLGERSRGSQDAGATSLALIFKAFADTIAAN